MEDGVSLKGFYIISCERANYISLVIKDHTWCPDRLRIILAWNIDHGNGQVEHHIGFEEWCATETST